MVRPTRSDLIAAQNKTIPDVIAPGLRVLFCGINPGLYSGATGHHFARPGNRFWPALQLAGITEELVAPAEEKKLLGYGYGITNLVARATARADELAPEELVEGRRRLLATVERYGPAYVAILGISAYRTAFVQRKAVVGPQPDPLGGAKVWVLPNPSGLNAHYQLPELANHFRLLRKAARQERET
jgi:TDG/mug DNA glycosylase family protein